MDLVHHLNDRLLFAVPKKGRLQQACLDLLSGSDIQFHRHNRLDITLVKNLPIALVFLPAADIPLFVGEGRVDLGITGRDQIAEHEAIEPPTETTGVEEIMDLEFGMCKLQVQVPQDGDISSPEQLIGKTIATSFTNLSAQYFRELESNKTSQGQTSSAEKAQTQTKIKNVSGSVEASCALGAADGIVDLVESGDTMRAAGLKPIATVLQSTAVLIRSKRPSDAKLVSIIAGRIRGVITAQKYSLITYNIERKNLAAASQITPGKRAPTITSLSQDEDWVAVSAMVLKKDIGTVMDQLIEIGASDILATRIENSRTD